MLFLMFGVLFVRASAASGLDTMTVRVLGADGLYSVNLSGCGKGRKRGETVVFSTIDAGARCKVTIAGVSSTFTAKKTVTCRFTDGGAILKCR